MPRNGRMNRALQGSRVRFNPSLKLAVPRGRAARDGGPWANRAPVANVIDVVSVIQCDSIAPFTRNSGNHGTSVRPGGHERRALHRERAPALLPHRRPRHRPVDPAARRRRHGRAAARARRRRHRLPELAGRRRRPERASAPRRPRSPRSRRCSRSSRPRSRRPRPRRWPRAPSTRRSRPRPTSRRSSPRSCRRRRTRRR